MMRSLLPEAFKQKSNVQLVRDLGERVPAMDSVAGTLKPPKYCLLDFMALDL